MNYKLFAFACMKEKLHLPKIIFLSIFFLTTSISIGQELKRNYLGGSFGGSDFHIKDEHASPLIFNSIGIAPSIQFFHKGDESRHNFEIGFYTDHLTTTSDNFETVNNRGRIRYAYLHSISGFKFLEREAVLFLGGSICTYLSHSDYKFLKNSRIDDRSSESWYWNNSLDLSAQLEYFSGGKTSLREFFSLQIFIPVVSNISRPKYSPSGDFNYTDNDWKFKMIGDENEFFFNSFSLDAVLTYQHPLAGNFNFQFSYEFYYSSYNKPADIKMFMNNLRLGFFFCF